MDGKELPSSHYPIEIPARISAVSGTLTKLRGFTHRSDYDAETMRVWLRDCQITLDEIATELTKGSPNVHAI